VTFSPFSPLFISPQISKRLEIQGFENTGLDTPKTAFSKIQGFEKSWCIHVVGRASLQLHEGLDKLQRGKLQLCESRFCSVILFFQYNVLAISQVIPFPGTFLFAFLEQTLYLVFLILIKTSQDIEEQQYHACQTCG
jgi:hypothetical protein